MIEVGVGSDRTNAPSVPYRAANRIAGHHWGSEVGGGAGVVACSSITLTIEPFIGC